MDSPGHHSTRHRTRRHRHRASPPPRPHNHHPSRHHRHHSSRHRHIHHLRHRPSSSRSPGASARTATTRRRASLKNIKMKSVRRGSLHSQIKKPR